MFEYERIDFEKSMASQSAKWIGSDFLFRNMCFLFPLQFILIELVLCIIKFSTIRQYGIPTAFFIITAIILSLRAIIQNNKFTKTGIDLPLTELGTLLKKELEQAGWKINRSNVKYLTAHKTGFWLAGTKIAILFNNNDAYINVQNIYGNGAYFPFSFGKNKRYVTMISQIIKDSEEAGSSK